jgi:hypothetical protein
MNTALSQLVPYADLRTRYGDTRSRTAIRAAIKKQKFPAPVETSPGRIAFKAHELDDHYANLPTRTYPTKPEAA